MAGKSDFPFSKLLYMIVRQCSRPFATRVRKLAKRSPMFKKYVCLPPALFFMWSERVVDNLARGGPAKAVPPYVEKKAVRLGSNLIGEFCIFAIAATFISLEFLRQRRKRRQRMQEEMLGKELLRRRALETQYNRDRRTSDLKDLHDRADDLQRRLLGSVKVDMTDDRTEPDSVSGIRIEDAYLEKGVKVRAYEGADVDQKIRSAAEAARTVATMKGQDKEIAEEKAKVAAVAVKETARDEPASHKAGIVDKTRKMEKFEKKEDVDKGEMSAGSTKRAADKVAVALEAPTIEEAVDERERIHKEVEKHVHGRVHHKHQGREDGKPKSREERVAEQVEAPKELELAVHHDNPIDYDVKSEEIQTDSIEKTHTVDKPSGKSFLSWDSIFDNWIPRLTWNSLYYAMRLRRQLPPVYSPPHESVREPQSVSLQSPPCTQSHYRHVFPARSYAAPGQQPQPPHT